MKSRVALVKGNDRYDNIGQALDLIGDDIDLGDKKRILIKPNFVSTRRQLAATHVEAVQAVLAWLRPRYDGLITIGEGAAVSDTFDGYRNFGYLDLPQEYNVRFVDLNQDEWGPVQVYDRKLRPMGVRVAKTTLESDFRISVGPPKTHDAVIVTLSLKNMVVGSMIQGRGGGLFQRLGQLLPNRLTNSALAEMMKSRLSTVNRSDKFALHQGYHGLNLNLYTLAKIIAPHLSVIDGFVGMEGSGPSSGDPVDLRVAIASTDFLAADTVATRLMGFDPDAVGYLHYCNLGGLGASDLNDIKIVGNATIEECAKEFRPHPTYEQQLGWRIPDVERYVTGDMQGDLL
jgi:uncharacterized protein (DUF362 family)